MTVFPEESAETFEILEVNPIEDPKWAAMAWLYAQDAARAYQERLSGNAQAQTFERRRSRLRRIDSAAKDLLDALTDAGSECFEELEIVGGCFPAPNGWAPGGSTLSDYVGLHPAATFPGTTKAAPAFAMQVGALMAVVEASLGNAKLAPQSGRGKKPATVGEASPLMHLVNDCWSLMVRFHLEPTGGAIGPLARLAASLGGMATKEHWSTDRVKREVSKVVKIRRHFDELHSELDDAWDHAGSPLLRGPHEIDEVIHRVSTLLERAVEDAEGLLAVPHRVVAWRALNRPGPGGA